MKKIIALTLSIGLISVQAQSIKYWVFLNEATPSFSQVQLGPDALARRAAQGIPLRASDFALPADAVASVASVAPVVGRSRWLRAVVVSADAPQREALRALPAVASVQPVGLMRRPLTDYSLVSSAAMLGNSAQKSAEEDGVHSYQYGASLDQVLQIRADALHDAGFDGAGVKVAILDGGFFGANTFSAFTTAWQQGRVLETLDYVDGDTNVFHLGSHGMSVWSTICSDLDGTFVGTAPKASFYLYKTENQASETIAEEYNWVMAAERADSLGVDVINTSLGYTTFDNGIDDHSYADMDGRTTPISRAAVAAARTGMILCISAGNEGASTWKYISAPADADSILAVGAVDVLGVRASFSSQGPSADGRIKPDVAARGLGATVMNSNGAVASSSGTSFSSPILAGAMASLVQAAKTLPGGYSAQGLIQQVRLSASQSFAPDSLLGYGIPNFATVLASLEVPVLEADPSWTVVGRGDGGWTVRRSSTGPAVAAELLSVDGRVLWTGHVPATEREFRIPAHPFWTYLRVGTQILPVAAR